MPLRIEKHWKSRMKKYAEKGFVYLLGLVQTISFLIIAIKL